jgi:hypothetical protein
VQADGNAFRQRRSRLLATHARGSAQAEVGRVVVVPLLRLHSCEGSQALVRRLRAPFVVTSPFYLVQRVTFERCSLLLTCGADERTKAHICRVERLFFLANPGHELVIGVLGIRADNKLLRAEDAAHRELVHRGREVRARLLLLRVVPHPASNRSATAEAPRVVRQLEPNDKDALGFETLGALAKRVRIRKRIGAIATALGMVEAQRVDVEVVSARCSERRHVHSIAEA